MNKIKNYWKKKLDLIHWKKKPTKIFSFDPQKKFKWFDDGKLNIYENCIKKNLIENEKKEAIIFYDQNKDCKKYSYRDLDNGICNLSKVIDNYHLKKNDIVAIHASASPESAISMLACAKIGLTFSVIFEDLPEPSMIKRLEILKPKILITRSYGKKLSSLINDLKKNKKKFSNLRILNLNDKKNKKISKIKHYLTSSIITKVKDSNFKKIKFVNSNHPLFVLFTSGSTGDPKGIVHSTGGYFLYCKYTSKEQFGMNTQSKVLTASDAGWINGHTYSLFGPLSFGATSILLEKPIDIIEKIYLQNIINDNNLTILYLPVTLIRVIKSLIGRERLNIKKKLMAIGSMGEPLAKSVSNWFSKKFANEKLAVVNTYFQTETGGIISSPKFNSKPPTIFDGTVGNPVNRFIKFNLKKNDKKNFKELKISTPWPGALINVINSKKNFLNYWDNKNFNMFDLGKYNKNNLLEVTGRNDDVINIRGHRIGSGEIESLILSINEIKEACVVTINDALEGSKLVVFYSKSNQRNNELSEKIEKKLINFFGSFIKPKLIIKLTNLPKTKSGKILRRVLRILAKNPKDKNIGDVSTIFDKNIINEIKKNLIRAIDE